MNETLDKNNTFEYEGNMNVENMEVMPNLTGKLFRQLLDLPSSKTDEIDNMIKEVENVEKNNNRSKQLEKAGALNDRQGQMIDRYLNYKSREGADIKNSGSDQKGGEKIDVTELNSYKQGKSAQACIQEIQEALENGKQLDFSGFPGIESTEFDHCGRYVRSAIKKQLDDLNTDHDWMTSLLQKNIGIDDNTIVEMLGVRGNAWDIIDNLRDHDADIKYNLYQKYEDQFDNERLLEKHIDEFHSKYKAKKQEAGEEVNVDKSDTREFYRRNPDEMYDKISDELVKTTKSCLEKSEVPNENIEQGDVVGLFWENSDYHDEALEPDQDKTKNTHVGYISDVVTINGKKTPVVTHNVKGMVINQPISQVDVTWVASPDYDDVSIEKHSEATANDYLQAAGKKVGNFF